MDIPFGGKKTLQLIDLLEDVMEKVTLPTATPDMEVSGLTADSRQVRPGYLFAALPGTQQDGRAYIPDAIRNGARAVLAPPGTALNHSEAVLIESPDPRASLAHLAAAFSRPQPHSIVAVTGTNGKTSVAHFTRQLWTLLGHQAASIGTLGLQLPNGTTRPRLTTPDPVTLHRDLACMAAQGTQHAVIEASSHGLSQRRLDGVRLKAAAFTNLSRDHLDYHDSEEDYFAAKLRLFDVILADSGYAVLNADSPRFSSVASASHATVLSYGRRGRDLKILNTAPRGALTRLELEAFGRHITLDLPFLDGFQIENVVCAAGLVIACGDDRDATLESLTQLADVPGRLQRISHVHARTSVFVDYAHTPDALAAVLQALRPHTSGRLIVVFGCGGDRDPGKRPLMGRVASRMADEVVLTDDNPRNEDPRAIRAEVLAGAPQALEIPDRAQAIETAVTMLVDGDVLVIAGKGHETGQIVGDRTLPFDDADVARGALRSTGKNLL